MMAIDGYPIDIFEKEKLVHKSEITDHPVEEGGDVTDNIHNLPDELEIEGVVSDTPVGEIADDPSRQGDDKPSTNAYQRLLKVHTTREPVTVVCFRGKFGSMALEELSVDTEAKTSKGLCFTGKFKKLRIVQNRRTTVAPTQGRGAANWKDKFNNVGVTYVNTVRGEASLKVYTKIYGPPEKATAKNVAGDGPVPILKPIPKGEYYFKTGKNGTPDAIIRKGVVYPFNLSGGEGVPGTSTYEYGKFSWVDGENHIPLTKEEPSMESWDRFTTGADR